MTESISCQITSAELALIDERLAHTEQTRSEWLHGLVQAALNETPTKVRNLAERITPSSTPSIYDVEEDEPDEILYDFLEVESASSSSSSSSLPSRSASSSGSIYDEDDEPYEILYDFLEPNDQ